MKKKKTETFLSLSGSLGRTHRTKTRLSVVQRRTRGAERCSAPSSTSEVQTLAPLFFLGTDMLLTFQGEFCVSMIGRGALRCKKRGVKRRAARADQKKRSAAQRHTKWTSGEGAHFNSGYGSAKSGIRLSRTQQNQRPKANKNGPRDCSNVPKSDTTQTTGSYRSKTHKKMRKIMACLAKFVNNTGLPAAQAENNLRQYKNKCKNLPCHQRKPRPDMDSYHGAKTNVLVCQPKPQTTSPRMCWSNITKRAVVPHRRRLAPVTAVVW